MEMHQNIQKCTQKTYRQHMKTYGNMSKRIAQNIQKCTENISKQMKMCREDIQKTYTVFNRAAVITKAEFQ